MAEFDFYTSASSFYGQKAQLALHVKGIKYKLHEIDLLKFAHLEPWYLKLNPGGVVPTLRHGNSVIPESDEILRYMDVHFTPRLQPNPHSEQGQRCQYYLDRLAKIPIAHLTDGAILHPDLTENCQIPAAVLHRMRELLQSDTKLKVLRKHLVNNPDMVREYQARLKAAQAEKPAARSRDNIQMILARCGALLLDIDDQLDKVESVYGEAGRWLVGEKLCTVDLVLTVFLFRLVVLGFSASLFETKLPRVRRYYERAQSHLPGFSQVCRNFRA